MKQRNSLSILKSKLKSVDFIFGIYLLLPKSSRKILQKMLSRRISEPDITYEALEALVLQIRQAPLEQLHDKVYLETLLIPSLGLNNESLHQQPKSLSNYYGKGLHIWQYPNQISELLVKGLSKNNDYESYVEIGCRWGGTFILMSEYLKRFHNLRYIIAIDVIDTPKILRHYKRFLSLHGGPIMMYRKEGSNFLETKEFKALDLGNAVCFIDGDHSLQGVMRDHSLALDFANVIIHHDISSVAVPTVGQFWDFMKKICFQEWSYDEFVQQYSLPNDETYLGIGMMKRRVLHKRPN